MGLRERTNTKKTPQKNPTTNSVTIILPLHQSKSTVSCWIVLLGRHSTTQHSHHSYRHMNQRCDADRAQWLLLPTSYSIQGQTWGTGIINGWAILHFFLICCVKARHNTKKKMSNVPLGLSHIFPVVIQFYGKLPIIQLHYKDQSILTTFLK